MYYYYPGKNFPAISVTGPKCALMCSHCRGYYLQSMLKAESGDALITLCRTLSNKGVTGCLISGGCDTSGRVPLPYDAVQVIRDETDLVLNIHTGLVDEKTADELKNVNPHYISFEIPTPYSLQHLYCLDIPQKRYFESLDLLDGLKVVPHVMVGLEKEEERNTLKELERMGFSSLVLIVFTPTKGTLYEKRSIDTEDVGETFRIARSLFERLTLGCMRPRIRQLEEMAALFDAVVTPTRWARAQVEHAGVPVTVKETCCVVE